MDDWSDKKRTRDIRTNEDGRKRERSGETETHPTKRENRVITRNLNAEEKDCKELEGLIVELTATHDAETKSILQCHQEELRGMKERCRYLKGQFTIKNAESGGTVIRVALPLKRGNNNAKNSYS